MKAKLILFIVVLFNSNYSLAQLPAIADCNWYATSGEYRTQPCNEKQVPFPENKFQTTEKDTSQTKYLLADTSAFLKLKMTVKNSKTNEEADCIGFEVFLMQQHEFPAIFKFTSNGFENENFKKRCASLKTGDEIIIRKIQFKDSSGNILLIKGNIVFFFYL